MLHDCVQRIFCWCAFNEGKMENTGKEVIDIRDVIRLLLKKKKLFLAVWTVTFIVACAIILPVPRTYSSTVTVAPEMGEGSAGGTIASIASSLGFNMDNMSTTDAFYPDIYPDVMASNDFVANLLKVKVKTSDGLVNTDYYTYLKSHQKSAFYMLPVKWVMYELKKMKQDKDHNSGKSGKEINTFKLTETQTMIFEMVKQKVECSIDKKTGVISINAKDQDPLVCATIADSAMVHLQDFIIRYRTGKARIDCDYYSKLLADAKRDYETSMRKYVKYCDSHADMMLQSELSERDLLENDMSQKLNTYNTLSNQLALVKAKVRERTPAFSQLQGATVPVKAAGPKRMLFVIGMLFLATLGTVATVFKKDILNNLSSRN